MDFILVPAHPEHQRALPGDPGACSRCEACAWRGNDTYSRHWVVLDGFEYNRWQCKAYLGITSLLLP